MQDHAHYKRVLQRFSQSNENQCCWPMHITHDHDAVPPKVKHLSSHEPGRKHHIGGQWARQTMMASHAFHNLKKGVSLALL